MNTNKGNNQDDIGMQSKGFGQSSTFGNNPASLKGKLMSLEVNV
jgi:hypothetical protein